jgi:hypothetical protein
MPANRGFTDEAQPSLETRLLLGALAGVVGTAAMTVAMRALHRRLPPQHRYPLPPREIVQEVLPEPAGHRIAEDHRQSLTMAAHFGYGAATAALYARPGPRPAPVLALSMASWCGELAISAGFQGRTSSSQPPSTPADAML